MIGEDKDEIVKEMLQDVNEGKRIWMGAGVAREREIDDYGSGVFIFIISCLGEERREGRLRKGWNCVVLYVHFNKDNLVRERRRESGRSEVRDAWEGEIENEGIIAIHRRREGR